MAAAAAAVGLALCPDVAMTTGQACMVMPTPPQVPTLLPPLPLLLLMDWLLTGRLHLPAVRTATMSNPTPGGHWTAEGQSDLDESRPQLLLLLLQHLTHCQLYVRQPLLLALSHATPFGAEMVDAAAGSVDRMCCCAPAASVPPPAAAAVGKAAAGRAEYCEVPVLPTLLTPPQLMVLPVPQ